MEDRKLAGYFGYTLVEILVVIALVAVVGSILTQIFYSALRGGNKAQILANIKQNGQIILETLDKSIRNADNVVCVSNSGDGLVIIKGGIYTRYRFNPPAPETNPISNGFVYQDSGQDCDLVIPYSVPPASVKLISNFDPKEGVSVLTGRFTRDRLAGFKDIITISFYVRPAEQANLKSVNAVLFSTTIQLR